MPDVYAMYGDDATDGDDYCRTTPGCCSSCGGTGAECSDCYGTGHAHLGPCPDAAKPESKYSDERLQELVRGYMVWEAGTLNTSRIESDDELTEADYARIQVLIDTADVEITWR